jgi:Asp/Glu/hydantoin racemase
MLELMQEAEADGCGAGVIGCFYDGGLRELREALRMPVVGWLRRVCCSPPHSGTGSRSSSGGGSGSRK